MLIPNKNLCKGDLFLHCYIYSNLQLQVPETSWNTNTLSNLYKNTATLTISYPPVPSCPSGCVSTSSVTSVPWHRFCSTNQTSWAPGWWKKHDETMVKLCFFCNTWNLNSNEVEYTYIYICIYIYIIYVLNSQLSSCFSKPITLISRCCGPVPQPGNPPPPRWRRLFFLRDG